MSREELIQQLIQEQESIELMVIASQARHKPYF